MLKLQKIELLGFKSFADRTEVVFSDHGVAAIVGPNGCGKSNISDAIHWVLGEQSAKALRSGRMQDVIFNGTPGRKATGMAEVHLTLFDPDGQVTLPSDAGSPSANGRSNSCAEAGRKIMVSRRLFASGESEYLLNGRACRLRDVQEIFLGTGLGPDAYAVIEQGRIGQILGSKPYELRAIIEEAAGVTKFKARRKLAWAKLESSKQNLSRVNDILDEIGRQLNSLKRQASRAQRYAELKEQMRAQLRVLLASHYHGTEQEAVRIAMDLGMLNRSLQERIELAEGSEKEQRDLHHLYEQQEEKLRHGVEEKSSLRLAAERARSQAASQAQQIGYLESRIGEAATEQERGGIRLQEMQTEETACAAFIDEIQAEIQSLQEQLRQSEGRFQNCQNNLKEKQQKLSDLRQELLEAVHQSATLQNQVLQLEQFLSATGRQMERAEAERASAETERESAAIRSGEIEAGMIRQRQELQAVRDRRRTLEESLRTGREEETRQRAALEEIRSGLAAQRGRMTSLQEVLARRAYSTETVQRLFDMRVHKDGSDYSAAAQGGNGNGAEAFEPVGVLADFIEADAAYERTIEAFLREELDYIVVKDWTAAKEGIHLLRAEVPGRATFLLHSGGSPDAAAHVNGHENGNGHGVLADYESLPGVLGPLENHVRLTNGFAAAAKALLPKLGRCYLVADAEAGRSLAGQYRESYFLTREGDWFHGDLVTAGKGDSAGPLALKRELRELARSLADQEQAAAQIGGELVRLAETVRQQQTALESAIEEQQQGEKRLVIAERDGKEAAGECDRLTRRVELAVLELERLRHEAERGRQQLAADREQIVQHEQRRLEIEAETAAVSAAVAGIEAEREQAHRQTAETRSRLAALEERHRASSEALARIGRSIQEHSNRLATLERQRDEWRRQKAGYEESNRQLEREAAAAEQRAEELALQVAAMEKNCELHRARLAELDRDLQVQRHDLEESREKKSAAEVQLARLESELDHLKESCRNELQVEMETLAAGQPVTLVAGELAAAEESYQQLKTKIEGMGPINMMALEEYEECRQRHDFLQIQRQDLLDSIRDTTQAIEEIDNVSQKQFAEAFEQINVHFQQMFQSLFGGGRGMLRLTDAENAGDCGVEIVAQPPGKKLQNVLLLSGGEKALTALALLLATFRYKPSPFCVLDEVDAPLDEANVGRFAAMVGEMSRDTQFILITHSRKTMSVAPVLYGVTMEEPGVSKIVSVKFDGSAVAPAPRMLAEEVAV